MGDLALYGGEGDSQPLRRGGKSLALLAYLAFSPGRRAPRRYLAELFWPGLEHRAQRHCLRQSLYRLRQITSGFPVIRSRGHELEGLPGVRFDFREGEVALGAGDYERAERLLRGDFLGGFSIPEAREFERWAESKRVGFHYSWVRAARTLAEERLNKGKAAAALETAETLAAHRPFDEKAIRLLMVALAASGRYALAAARFQSYARLLLDELDEEPSDELGRYARELQRCAKPAALRPTAKASFVGRSDGWAVLEDTWQGALGWDGALVLVQGGPGVGKTRLLNEFAERARAGGALVLSANRAEPAGGGPYGSGMEAPHAELRVPAVERLQRGLLAELARLLPDLPKTVLDVPEPDPDGREVASLSPLYRGLASRLRDLAGRDGLLVTIDDLHQVDGPSLQLIHFLAQHLRDTRALVLTAFRPHELAAEGWGLVESAVSDRLARLITLGDLKGEEAEHLPSPGGDAGEPSADERIAGYLEHFSGGNPALLYELLLGLGNLPTGPRQTTERPLRPGGDLRTLRHAIRSINFAEDTFTGDEERE